MLIECKYFLVQSKTQILRVFFLHNYTKICSNITVTICRTNNNNNYFLKEIIMKKILTALAMVAMVVGLTGCLDDPDGAQQRLTSTTSVTL